MPLCVALWFGKHMKEEHLCAPLINGFLHLKQWRRMRTENLQLYPRVLYRICSVKDESAQWKSQNHQGLNSNSADHFCWFAGGISACLNLFLWLINARWLRTPQNTLSRCRSLVVFLKYAGINTPRLSTNSKQRCTWLMQKNNEENERESWPLFCALPRWERERIKTHCCELQY